MMKPFLFFLLLIPAISFAQDKHEMLYRYYDSINDQCGYQNAAGEMIIPVGKYFVCFSDSMDQYAIVGYVGKGFVSIDRSNNIMYEVYPFDNGPDYPSEGTFRIIHDSKIGYADEKTGEVIVVPQYTCAEPFQNGHAKVSNVCTKHFDGEYHSWEMHSVSMIDKTGTLINLEEKLPEKSREKIEKRRKKIKTP